MFLKALDPAIHVNTAIVIPAFNEAASIGSVVAGLRQAGHHAIVVNDGSTDGTAEQAIAAGATVLSHIINRGQGAAIKTGIDYSLSKGADIIVTFDADGQHRVDDIPALLEPIKKGEVEVTLGSRFLQSTTIPLMRKILLKGSVLVLLLFYGMRMSDAHNGLRAFSRQAAQTIRFSADRMEHASEIIEEIKRHRLNYREVPVVVNYSQDTLKKGRGSFVEALRIFSKMVMKKLS